MVSQKLTDYFKNFPLQKWKKVVPKSTLYNWREKNARPPCIETNDGDN